MLLNFLSIRLKIVQELLYMLFSQRTMEYTSTHYSEGWFKRNKHRVHFTFCESPQLSDLHIPSCAVYTGCQKKEALLYFVLT